MIDLYIEVQAVILEKISSQTNFVTFEFGDAASFTNAFCDLANVRTRIDENVVAEMLAAIKRTPSVVSVSGTRENTVGLLSKLRPRVEELCKSSNTTTAMLARQARDWIREVERESK